MFEYEDLGADLDTDQFLSDYNFVLDSVRKELAGHGANSATNLRLLLHLPWIKRIRIFARKFMLMNNAS